MHDMLIAGFSAGGRHYCLTGGNLREDPPQKTPVPARPRRPGGGEVKRTTHAKQVSGTIREYYKMLYAEREGI